MSRLKFILSFFLLAVSFSAISQDINIAGFNFQGYAIDNEGKAIVNGTVVTTFTIGTMVEEHTLTTDDFGVFNAVIGSVKNIEFRKLDFKTPYEALTLKVQVQKNSGAQVTIYNGPLQSVPYARSAENGVPVGTIIAYSGASAPKGWLLCNGQDITKTNYPRLHTVIGSTWGNNGGETFKTPNLGGRFLRGAGAGNTGLTTEIPVLGTSYGDQNRSHNHTGTAAKHNHTFDDAYFLEDKSIFASNGPTNDPNFWVQSTEQNLRGAGGGDADNEMWFWKHGTHEAPALALTIANEGGAEARPVNAAVTYIIKY